MAVESRRNNINTSNINNDNMSNNYNNNNNNNNNNMSYGNLENLDDIGSFDSNSQQSPEGQRKKTAQSFSASSSPPQIDYNPVGLTIGQISPGGRSSNSEYSAYSRNPLHSVNAVHMHIQENAKIPNFNKPVDRSNSSIRRAPPYHTTTTRGIGGIGGGGGIVGGGGGGLLGLGGGGGGIGGLSSAPNGVTSSASAVGNINDDFSMAELFLSKESKYRRSLDQNYNSLGTLLSDVGLGGGGGRSSRRPSADGSSISARSDSKMSITDETQMEIDALTAAIDPTPWSEIEEKIHKDEEKAYQKRLVTTTNDPQQQQQQMTSTSHPHHYNYYPYGRHHQLPIPQKSSPTTQPKPSPPPSSSPTALGPSAVTAQILTADSMEEAVATAAAIASTQATATTTTPTPTSTTIGAASKIPPIARPPSTNAAPTTVVAPHRAGGVGVGGVGRPPNGIPPPSPYTKAQQTTVNPPPASTIRTYHRQRAAYTPTPHHGVAHTTNRGSVIAAASQKSQYGFGDNHTVPSVPGPPPGPLSAMKNGRLNNFGAAAAATGSDGRIPTRPGSGTPLPSFPNLHSQNDHMSSSSSSHPPNAGAAYERKKQRAKDARVKLNDAIERLSVAMNFAGSQSKIRNKLLSTDITETEVRSKSLQASEDCVKMAEQAKKWDRPSFVATAASLVQGLNTQCEALMNEVTVLDQLLKEALNGKNNNDNDNNNKKSGKSNNNGDQDAVMTNGDMNDRNNNTLNNGNDLTSHPEHKRHNHPQMPLSALMNGHSTKRIKQDNDGHTSPFEAKQHSSSSNSSDVESLWDDPSFDQKTVFRLIAKMLDPVTLCRCLCVSRKWRDMNVFESDDLWLELAVKRFGFYNVRQWTEKLEDDHGDISSLSAGSITATAAVAVSSKGAKKKLYRAMNAANIMPHVQQDCVSLLGDAKIPGRVSVWVFMVERSNGETLRSVKREPGLAAAASAGGAGLYHSSPVVELKIIIQNTGMANYPIILKNQTISVDVSTRRSGGELREITWDERFVKIVRNLDGTVRKKKRQVQPQQSIANNNNSSTTAIITTNNKKNTIPGTFGLLLPDEMCRLSIFDSIILEVHIHARGCSTTSKFQQRSNFTKLLVYFDGTTVPMVIPFLRDPGHGGH